MEAQAGKREVPRTEAELISEKIAERVRADSGNLAKLTSVDLLATLIPEPGKINFHLAEMAKMDIYRDIKPIVAGAGTCYLYSESSISREDAGKMALDEEVRSQIVVRARDDSGKTVRLTAVNALGALIPGAEPDRIDRHLGAILKDERYQDVRLITNSRGTRYLYSETFMTRAYAEILARAHAKDPVATIAATVRDESRIYPRPTRIDLFIAPVFNINPDELERHVTALLEKPEYDDMKLVKAPTGAVYLYSKLYLDEKWVKANVEWEEVEKYENP